MDAIGVDDAAKLVRELGHRASFGSPLVIDHSF
jgi:hypothetical protein